MKLHSKRWLTEEINKTSFSKEFWNWTYDFLFYILINTRQAILHSINIFIGNFREKYLKYNVKTWYWILNKEHFTTVTRYF